MLQTRRNTGAVAGLVVVLGLSGLAAVGRAPSFASDNPAFVDVPIADPAYGQLSAVQKAVFEPLPPPQAGKRTMTPYEFAADLMDVLPAIIPDASPPRFSSVILLPDAKQRLAADPKAFAAVTALMRRFAPIMRRMDKTANSVNQGLASLTPPFEDVPADHWAAAAVERLRKQGIVTGYPGSSFQER